MPIPAGAETAAIAPRAIVHTTSARGKSSCVMSRWTNRRRGSSPGGGAAVTLRGVVHVVATEQRRGAEVFAADGSLLALCAARPAGAANHDTDAVVAAVVRASFFSAHLSTTKPDSAAVPSGLLAVTR